MGSELGAALLQKGVSSMAGHRLCCESCRRSPLPGELLHELDSGKPICELCLAALPDAERRTVRSDRVPASVRALAAVPRAA